MKHVATWIRECDEAPFAQVFTAFPDVTLHNARTAPVNLEAMDGLLLTGGSDISAGFLKQPVSDPTLILEPDPVRDAWEFSVTPRVVARRLPLFAICRGLQVLNVALGGTLYLDIAHHDDHKFENVQPLRYTPETKLRFSHVNSSHHQAIRQLGQGLVVEAWSESDHMIEQVHLQDYPFGLAVQYHPERDPLYLPLFRAFVQALEEQL